MPNPKVKNMPRKQQMAVKASMAEKAAGKKSPNKMKDSRKKSKLQRKIKYAGMSPYNNSNIYREEITGLEKAPRLKAKKLKKSPVKATSKAAKNLLKAVPNKKAYNKLSDVDKKGFDKAAKKAGLPTKKSPTKMVSAKDNNAAIKEKKRKTRNKVTRVVKGVLTGGGSEVVRKAAKTKIGKKIIKKGKQVGRKVELALDSKFYSNKYKANSPGMFPDAKINQPRFANEKKELLKKSSALKMKTSPALAKLSASCKSAARRKFKVYPSAYANMWASKTQKKGKC